MDESRRNDGIIPNRILDPAILDTETRSNINDEASHDEEAQYLKMQNQQPAQNQNFVNEIPVEK